jgi:hypothetical protein
MAEEAIAVQDACNMSGVVHSFDRIVSDLADLARERGLGGDFVRSHPVVKMFADKIADLARVRTMEEFGEAYDACKELAARAAA